MTGPEPAGGGKEPGGGTAGPGGGAGRPGGEDGPAVTDNLSRRRFEAPVDGLLAYLSYRRNSKRLVLIHTDVPDEASGRGLGGTLVTAAIDQAARDGLTVVPLCPFARAWLGRHPDVAGRAGIDWG